MTGPQVEDGPRGLVLWGQPVGALVEVRILAAGGVVVVPGQRLLQRPGWQAESCLHGNALDGSTLAFPNGTSITTNQANIALGGTGLTIPAVQGITANSGSLASSMVQFHYRRGPQQHRQPDDRRGQHAGGERDYTQGSSASLTSASAATASGNDYGQLAITGSATLAGSVNASTASGFTPNAGDNFPIVTYASETGGTASRSPASIAAPCPIFQPVVGPINIALSTVTSPANLVVQPFSVAANATAGQNLTVTYQVDNESGNAATGSWTDSVYLSTQTTLNSSSVLLGRVQHTGGVAANGQYSADRDGAGPGLVPDNYYVIVLADSQGLVPELNRTSTELASTNPVQVTCPRSDARQPDLGHDRQRPSLYYQLTLPAGQDVAISANFAALQGGELYVGYQSIPIDEREPGVLDVAEQITQQVVIPDTQAGTYYILLQGDTGSGTANHSRCRPRRCRSRSPASAHPRPATRARPR